MNQGNEISGILLIDKPEGITSFSVVSSVRKILHTKKAGHAGTLDPFATGLLVVAVGKATRVLRYMENHDKTYRATMVLGSITDTGDKEGQVIGGKLPNEDELAELRQDDFRLVREAVMSMVGEITQVPSIYSAIKIAGRPAYEYARAGKEVEIPPRTITIHGIDIEKICEADGTVQVEMTVSCSKGTYIRTLCEDIGNKLGYGAYCLALRRLRSGDCHIENAISLETLATEVEQGNSTFLLGEMSAMAHMLRIEVSKEEAKELRCGKKLDFSLFRDRMEAVGVKEQETVLAVCQDEPIAVIYASEEEGKWLIREERVFA